MEYLITFLKELFKKYKNLPKQDTFISGGYDIINHDAYLFDKECEEYCKDFINKLLPKPDINSNEYHQYYKNLLLLNRFAKTLEKCTDIRYSLPVPKCTKVHTSQRD